MIATFLEYCFDFPNVSARWRQHAVAICIDVSSAEGSDIISTTIASRPTLALSRTHKAARSTLQDRGIMPSIILQSPSYSTKHRMPMMILPYDVDEGLGMHRKLPDPLAKNITR